MASVTLQYVHSIEHGGVHVTQTRVWKDGKVYATVDRRIAHNIKKITINCYNWTVDGWKAPVDLRLLRTN